MISSNPLVKTIVDQLFWRPLLIAYSFVLMNVLKGKSWAQIREVRSSPRRPLRRVPRAG
jgi:hypothetical protein